MGRTHWKDPRVAILKFTLSNVKMFVDIKVLVNVCENLVRKTQETIFYDGRLFLLSTVNLFGKRNHVFLFPNICFVFYS
jgi:hypothetical protein